MNTRLHSLVEVCNALGLHSNVEDSTVSCATIEKDKTVSVVIKDYSVLNSAFFSNLNTLAEHTKLRLFPTERDILNPTKSRELDSSKQKILQLTSNFMVYAEGLIDDLKQDKLDFKTAYKYLNYSPETGAVAWKLDINPMVPKGSSGGFKHSSGQHIIKIDGEVYRLNRVIWLLQTGAWPKGRIKHKDSDPNNLRWSNLYEEKS